MKRSLLATAGAVVLALVAILWVMPQSAQVDPTFAAQVDAAAAARFVNMYPDQYANFFVEQADATVAYCIDKTALYAFKEFEKGASMGKAAYTPMAKAEAGSAPKALRIASLADFNRAARAAMKAQEAGQAQEMKATSTDANVVIETPEQLLDKQIADLKAMVDQLPPNAESPMKDQLQQLLAEKEKVTATGSR